MATRGTKMRQARRQDVSVLGSRIIAAKRKVQELQADLLDNNTSQQDTENYQQLVAMMGKLDDCLQMVETISFPV